MSDQVNGLQQLRLIVQIEDAQERRAALESWERRWLGGIWCVTTIPGKTWVEAAKNGEDVLARVQAVALQSVKWDAEETLIESARKLVEECAFIDEEWAPVRDDVGIPFFDPGRRDTRPNADRATRVRLYMLRNGAPSSSQGGT